MSSNTVWGALRGLETFSQLVVYNFTAGFYQAFTAQIDDTPRYLFYFFYFLCFFAEFVPKRTKKTKKNWKIELKINNETTNARVKIRFSHRGFLMDTSRHFETLASLKRIIDALSYAKFNTFHWHIVDSQSFPYESYVYPKLWNGAYTVYERYSQNDVKEIVQYAYERGIRVIVEFDMPGHG